MYQKFKILFLLLCLPLGYLSAQTDMPVCITPVCNTSSIKVEMVRVNANVQPSCAPQSCGEGDGFYQMYYKVYLRYSRPTNSVGLGNSFKYALSYNQLSFGVQLNGGTRSVINSAKTMDCYESSPTGKYWNGFESTNGDKPKFEVVNNQAIITFQQALNSTNDCGISGVTAGNDIVFDFHVPPPPGVDFCPQGNSCAYVELFTVIVDAYPGESINLSQASTNNVYVPANSSCNPPTIPVVNTGTMQAATSVPINNPTTALSTPNEPLKLFIATPETFSNPCRSRVPIQLKNKGDLPVTVKYLEFIVTAQINTLVAPFQFSGHTPLVTENNGVRSMYYKVELSSANIILPGDAITIASIDVGPEEVTNVGWLVAFSLPSEESAHTRIKTTVGGTDVCTNLAIDPSIVTAYCAGNDYCSEFKFTSELLTVGCNKNFLRVGIKHDVMIDPYFFFKRVEMIVSLPDANVAFNSGASADFTNWPSINCANNQGGVSCFPTTPDCYRIINDDKTFHYCFNNTTSSGEAFFANTNHQYIDIPIIVKAGACVNDINISQLVVEFYSSAGGGNTYECVPQIEATIGLPLCGKSIEGKITTETLQGVEDVLVTVTSDQCIETCSSPNLTTFTAATGNYGFCDICKGCGTYTVTPTSDIDPLNGVNSWDLVLISRHILGLESLSTPYKLISADANRSGTVTTFDIVELRKLILGTYSKLPNNTSWRFIDKEQVFTDNANPFADVFKENITIISGQYTPPTYNFIGCKIGDLNLTAIPNNRPAPLPETYLSWDMAPAKSAKTFTVPVVYTGETAVTALQFGLQFNPALVTLVGPTAGDVPGMNDSFFGLDKTDEGLIRFSWNAMDLDQTPVAPGAVLFYLTFERTANEALRDAEPVLTLDESVLAANAWLADGTPYQLVKSTAVGERKIADTPASLLNASVHPNPTAGPATLQLTSPEAGKMRLTLMNAYGQRVALRDVSVVKGTQTVPLNEAANLPAGIYQWWIRTPDGSSAQGQLVIK